MFQKSYRGSLVVDTISAISKSDHYKSDALHARVIAPYEQYTNPEIMYVDGITPFRTVGKSRWRVHMHNFFLMFCKYDIFIGYEMVYRASALQSHETISTGQVVDPFMVYPPGTDFLECYQKFLLPTYLEVCLCCVMIKIHISKLARKRICDVEFPFAKIGAYYLCIE